MLVPVPTPVLGFIGFIGPGVVAVAGELPVGVEPEEPVAAPTPVEGETESELVLQVTEAVTNCRCYI